MIVTSQDNIITITLTPDEKETYDYMNNVSGLLFQEHIIALFNNRKRQQEEDLRVELTRTMSRDELKQEIERKRNG